MGGTPNMDGVQGNFLLKWMMIWGYMDHITISHLSRKWHSNPNLFAKIDPSINYTSTISRLWTLYQPSGGFPKKRGYPQSSSIWMASSLTKTIQRAWGYPQDELESWKNPQDGWAHGPLPFAQATHRLYINHLSTSIHPIYLGKLQ